MRVLLVLLLILLPAATVSAAGPSLVGTSGSGPIRYLDRDLEPIAGTPKLPRSTDGTVRSPDGKRFATWNFERGTISVRSSSGRVMRKLRTGGGVEVSWPSRHRIVAVTTEHGKRPTVIRVFRLDTRRTTTHRLAGTPREIETGPVTRVLIDRGTPGLPSGFRLAVVGRSGRVRTESIAVPDGMTSQDVSLRLRGDRLLASQDNRHALVDPDGTTTPLDLARGSWDWLTDDLIEYDGEVVHIDRETGALGDRVTVDRTQYLTGTPDGGFLVGIGQARYDRDLELVATNAVPADTEHTPIVFAGTRFYAIAYDCSGIGSDFRMVIGSAGTGRVLAERPGGRWRVGRLGDGYFRAERFDIDCE